MLRSQLECDQENLPWLVANVNSHVGVQGRATIEGFGADIALVRLLLGVYDFVPTQSASLPEALAANLAHERSNTCVNGHMPRQVVVGVETLAALIALEHFATIIVIIVAVAWLSSAIATG